MVYGGKKKNEEAKERKGREIEEGDGCVVCVRVWCVQAAELPPL